MSFQSKAIMKIQSTKIDQKAKQSGLRGCVQGGLCFG